MKKTYKTAVKTFKGQAEVRRGTGWMDTMQSFDLNREDSEVIVHTAMTVRRGRENWHVSSDAAFISIECDNGNSWHKQFKKEWTAIQVREFTAMIHPLKTDGEIEKLLKKRGFYKGQLG